MPIHLDDYLQARGFCNHPFTARNAVEEQGHLPSFFVQVDWFDRLVGNQSLLLFAPQGHGKTSHRIEVARRARERHKDRALVIAFTGFDLLLQRGAEQPSTASYLDIIRRMTLEELDTQLQQHIDCERALRENMAAYARFYALLHQHAPGRAFDKSAPPNAQAFIHMLQSRQISAKESLIELSQLAQAARFSYIYFLLDGIDEWPETTDNTATMIDLLRPLLSAPGFLQDCGIAFKFFLPQSLYAPIKEQFRLDRFLSYSLTWSEQQLLFMLSQRLTFYSRISETSERGRVEHFQDLCDGSIPDVDLRLVRAAGLSPRKLIELADAILALHCRSAGAVDEPISGATISQVLGGAVQPPAPQPSSQAASPVPLSDELPRIFVDARGDIFLGDRPLAKRPSKYLHRCIRYLWDHRDRLVSSEELIEAIYHDDPADIRRGDPKESLVKIIGRLRKEIEPAHVLASTQTRSRTYVYIDGQPSTGFVLRHFVESQKEL